MREKKRRGATKQDVDSWGSIDRTGMHREFRAEGIVTAFSMWCLLTAVSSTAWLPWSFAKSWLKVLDELFFRSMYMYECTALEINQRQPSP